MTKLQRIITETINRFLLREFHHTTDNGLVNDCNLLFDRVKFLIDNNIDEFNRKPVYLPSIDKTFGVILTDKYDCAVLDGLHRDIYINKTTAKLSLEDENAYKELLSSIYHELGHWVQIQKADRLSVINRSFLNPSFFSLKQSEYHEILRKLYCFHDRELKARFYGTYMWLLQHKGENISIQDVYDSYACRLTPMREILSMLNNIAHEGEQSAKAFIIKELYRDTYCKNRTGNRAENATFDKQAQRVIYYFTKRLNYFKARIDKIYYDWKSNQNAEAVN